VKDIPCCLLHNGLILNITQKKNVVFNILEDYMQKLDWIKITTIKVEIKIMILEKAFSTLLDTYKIIKHQGMFTYTIV